MMETVKDNAYIMADAHIKLNSAIDILELLVDNYNLDAGEYMSNEDLMCIKYNAGSFTNVLNTVSVMLHDALESIAQTIE